MTYTAQLTGIFIQDIYGNLYTEDKWDGTQTANGVAVITEDCSFVIGLDSNSLAITGEGSGSLDDYMTSNYLEDNSIPESALNDYNGEANTANILKAESSADYAAGWCNSFIFPNGKKGFLPALGQLLTIFNNLSEINNALSALNVSEIDYKKKYFSSTYYGILLTSEAMYGYGKSNDTDELIFYVISPTENNTIIPLTTIDNL